MPKLLRAQRLKVSYVPLELGWAVRRLIRRVRPRAAVMTEIDTWPVLLATIRRQGVPLAMANAQYPKKSIVRDRKWGGFRAGIFQAYELVLCKSETHAQRFRDVGCERVVIAGETRFDLPVSPQQIAAAQALLAPWQLATAASGRTAGAVFCQRHRGRRRTVHRRHPPGAGGPAGGGPAATAGGVRAAQPAAL